MSDSELKSGRIGAAYDDTKFLSPEGEWFLAGVLDGIADGAINVISPSYLLSIRLRLVMPMVRFTLFDPKLYLHSTVGAHNQRLQTPSRRRSFLGAQRNNLWLRFPRSFYPHYSASLSPARGHKARSSHPRR